MNRSWWTSPRRRTPRAQATRPRTCLLVEDLETRIAPAVKATYTPDVGMLSVTIRTPDTIRLTVEGGSVLVNGAAPLGGPVVPTDIRQLKVTGSAGADTIDLSGLPTGSLPQLLKTS